MQDKRPSIPAAIAREVRQRCLFGCVFCGLPIYQYDHMLGWSQVKRHIASEITLLCDYHHSKKTRGLITNEEVIEQDRNPFNIREKKMYSKPDPLSYYGNTAIIQISSCTFSMNDNGNGAEMIALLVSGFPIIKVNLADQHFLLNITLFDDQNNIILSIQDNVMMYKVDIWDVTFSGRTLTIKQERRKIFLEVDFVSPNKMHFKRGMFYFHRNVFDIGNNSLKINGVLQLTDMSISQCRMGIVL